MVYRAMAADRGRVRLAPRFSRIVVPMLTALWPLQEVALDRLQISRFRSIRMAKASSFSNSGMG